MLLLLFAQSHEQNEQRQQNGGRFTMETTMPEAKKKKVGGKEQLKTSFSVRRD